MTGTLPANIMVYLTGRLELARVMLFTGAGFSVGAKNIDGKQLPSTADLKRAIWELSFPGTAFDQSATLQHLYESARLRKRGDLAHLLSRMLTVDPDSLPTYYKSYFSGPWRRVYTLNVDDLPEAASRKYSLPRKIETISGSPSTRQHTPLEDSADAMNVVHLNGTIRDLPDEVTFSMRQYAARLGQTDPFYAQLSADLLSHTFIFIGTTIDEPPLWQHIEQRRSRGGRDLRELRPRSYLVTPSLDAPRQSVLREYNVEWVPMTAEEFANQVLEALAPAAATGHVYLAQTLTSYRSRPSRLPDVSEQLDNPHRESDYLMGQEPIWADLQAGRAIERDCDHQIWDSANEALTASGERGAILITGTAASGKSTALMRLAMRLVADKGLSVGWIDRDCDFSLGSIRQLMAQRDAPRVLGIDDADLYGSQFCMLLREIIRLPARPLVIFAARSGKLDKLLNPALLADVQIREIAMPHLSNADVDALIDLLDRENRLGVLKGKSRSERQAAFRGKADRQLLVAMIEATSGRRFEEKVYGEFSELAEDARLAYAIIALATSLRHNIARDEVLIATGASSNEMLNSVDRLVARKIVTSRDPAGTLQARHRRIAEILVDELVRAGILFEVVRGLAFLVSTKVHASLTRSARPWRLLRHLLNHEFLARTLGVDQARSIYGYLEEALHWDYHFWLQRGSLEVELGTIQEAENFLSQARSLASDDPYVLNEWAYLLFRKALNNPGAADAKEMVGEAISILEELIETRGTIDPYPFHVLGSQGLAWARRGLVSTTEKQEHLQLILRQVEAGVKHHPRSKDLSELRQAIQEAALMTTVVTGSS